MRQEQDILIRGTREGLLILISDKPDFATVIERLAAKLHASGRFFRGAEVTISVGRRPLTGAQRATLQELIEGRYGLVLQQVREGEDLTDLLERTVRPAGSAERVAERAAERAAERNDWASVVPSGVERMIASGSAGAAEQKAAPQVVVRTLRSGQAIRHRGDVIIIGDVNPGAEVIATGHIIVFGILRGVAHAGAGGDETAIVAALKLLPTQLRIGHRVGRAPDEDRGSSTYVPEVARVVDGQIIIESRELRPNVG